MLSIVRHDGLFSRYLKLLTSVSKILAFYFNMAKQEFWLLIVIPAIQQNRGEIHMSGNREYKSDVFSMLLEDKTNALQLYNALNKSEYTDPEMVEIRTLDKGVSLSVRNDAAFVLDSNLSIYEHQSTVCPNMPVRCIIYFSSIIEKMVKSQWSNRNWN